MSDLNKKSKSKVKLFSIIFILIVIILGGVFMLYKFNILGEKEKVSTSEQKEVVEPKEKEKLKIYDMDSDQRPVAVMLDNNKHAWPHSGINSAYAIYEIEVEGGESRLMAVFKNKKDTLKAVGPIRSARHYFLDYAKEHDAIYAHIGQSPRAEKELSEGKFPDINGQIYDSGRTKNSKNTKEYWRNRDKSAPHNSYTSMLNLFNIAESRGYKTKSDNIPPFKYSIDEVNLDSDIIADKIKAGYHSGNMTVYNYDKSKKAYTKTSKGVLQKDESGELYTAKNLVILKTDIRPLEGFGSGSSRVDVKTKGKLKGYFFTNGKGIHITAEKQTRNSKTKYLDENGKEIMFNDGRTLVMIIPNKQNISITENSSEK